MVPPTPSTGPLLCDVAKKLQSISSASACNSSGLRSNERVKWFLSWPPAPSGEVNHTNIYARCGSMIKNCSVICCHRKFIIAKFINDDGVGLASRIGFPHWLPGLASRTGFPHWFAGLVCRTGLPDWLPVCVVITAGGRSTCEAPTGYQRGLHA